MKTIKIRFPAVAQKDGSWAVAGRAGESDETMLGWAYECLDEGYGARLSWVTAEITIPDPEPEPEEVVGTVEPEEAQSGPV